MSSSNDVVAEPAEVTPEQAQQQEVTTPATEESQEASTQLSADELTKAFMNAAMSNDFDKFAELEQQLHKDIDSNKGGTQTEKPSEEVEGQKAPETTEAVTEPVATEGQTEGTHTGDNVAGPSMDARLKQQLDQLKNLREAARTQPLKKAEAPKAQEVVTPAPTPEAPVAPIVPEELEAPEVPVKPDVPTDPVDWTEEDVKKLNQYDASMQEYYNKQNALITKLAAAVRQPVQATDSVLEQRLSAIEQEFAEKHQQLEQEAANRRFWDEIRSFQRKASTFATDDDIEVIHNNIDSFADKLTVAAGYTVNPADPVSLQAFEQAKIAVLNGFANGDDNIVKVAETSGLGKPVGFDQYISIRDIVERKNEAVTTGRLGQQAPLYTVYLDNLAATGELDEVLNTLAAEEREKAFRATADTITEANSAVRTVSNAPSVSSTAVVENTQGLSPLATMLVGKGLTAEEAVFLEQVNNNPNLLMSPKNLERFNELNSKAKL